MMSGALKKSTYIGKGTENEKTVWRLAFEVCLLFGRTELEAQLVWKDSKVCV